MPSKARTRTRKHPNAGARRSGAETTQREQTPAWRWRTFPVFAAFSCGLLLAFLVNEGSHNPAAFFVQIAALLGVGFSLAHLVVTNVVVAGRARRRQAAADRGEAPGEETEEVVVYPQDDAAPRRG